MVTVEKPQTGVVFTVGVDVGVETVVGVESGVAVEGAVEVAVAAGVKVEEDVALGVGERVAVRVKAAVEVEVSVEVPPVRVGVEVAVTGRVAVGLDVLVRVTASVWVGVGHKGVVGEIGLWQLWPNNNRLKSAGIINTFFIIPPSNLYLPSMYRVGGVVFIPLNCQFDRKEKLEKR